MTVVIETFLVGVGVVAPQEFEELKQRLSVEMLEDSFRGIVYTLTAWGQKP